MCDEDIGSVMEQRRLENLPGVGHGRICTALANKMDSDDYVPDVQEKHREEFLALLVHVEDGVKCGNSIGRTFDLAVNVVAMRVFLDQDDALERNVCRHVDLLHKSGRKRLLSCGSYSYGIYGLAPHSFSGHGEFTRAALNSKLLGDLREFVFQPVGVDPRGLHSFPANRDALWTLTAFRLGQH